MSSRKWQDWLGVAAGAFLALSPWILGFSANTGAVWTFVILGVLIAGAAMVAQNRSAGAGSQWLVALFGAAAFFSPWVFGFGLNVVRWDAWIVGALVVVLALWALVAGGGETERRAMG